MKCIHNLCSILLIITATIPTTHAQRHSKRTFKYILKNDTSLQIDYFITMIQLSPQAAVKTIRIMQNKANETVAPLLKKIPQQFLCILAKQYYLDGNTYLESDYPEIKQKIKELYGFSVRELNEKTSIINHAIEIAKTSGSLNLAGLKIDNLEGLHTIATTNTIIALLLNDNLLKKLPAQEFKNLGQLTYLNLTNNPLIHIDYAITNYLENLQIIELSNISETILEELRELLPTLAIKINKVT